MKNALSIIISREYLERVKRKSFIISTILMPILMVGMMAFPTIIAVMSKPEERVIAVIDDTGVLASSLKNSDQITFRAVNTPLADLKADENYEGILTIGRNAVSNPAGAISLYTRDASSMATENYITGQLEDAITDCRIRTYNIDNLAQILREVKPEISINTLRIDDDAEEETSTALSYILGMFTMLVLYMFILIYGQMVMTSIIEEKNNRVLELVVSSVKPMQLMMGKILGVGLVAITQILIWGAILVAASLWLMPALTATLAAESSDPGMLQALYQLGDPVFMATLMLMLTIFLIGGYLFYSSIFAAIGSAVDNIQDASQLTSLAVVPIIFALMVAMAVVADPNSSLAVWTSIIPFTSPMVMMARIPFGVPLWQEIVSVAVLFLSFFGMIWITAKIYRVGIFMYGKKPSIAELIRWTRYK